MASAPPRLGPTARLVLWGRGLPVALTNRAVGLGLLLPTGTVLGIARALTPDPAGVGTHRQLGLGPCLVLTLTGYPCPMCGMTTTFSLLAHGELLRAVCNQPFGVVLFSITAATAMVGAADLLSGRGLWRRAFGQIERLETQIAVGLLMGLIAGWAYKIVLMKNFFMT